MSQTASAILTNSLSTFISAVSNISNDELTIMRANSAFNNHKKMERTHQMTNKNVVWSGHNPGTCDTCGNPIIDKFYDAKTSRGGWACMCLSCFTLGPGNGQLGKGRGQEYTKQTVDGEIQFVKTDG